MLLSSEIVAIADQTDGSIFVDYLGQLTVRLWSTCFSPVGCRSIKADYTNATPRIYSVLL